MKRNTKGFTLIELLAVIVVLAIIALIATPIVLNLIDDARRGAAEATTTGYMEAVENSVLKAMLDNTDTVVCSEYEIADGAKIVNKKSGAEGCLESLAVDVEDKSLPEQGGTIKFNTNGSVDSADVKVGKFNIHYADGKSKAS